MKPQLSESGFARLEDLQDYLPCIGEISFEKDGSLGLLGPEDCVFQMARRGTGPRPTVKQMPRIRSAGDRPPRSLCHLEPVARGPVPRERSATKRGHAFILTDSDEVCDRFFPLPRRPTGS